MHSIFENYDSAWITSLWGWSPDTWGCWAFSQRGRRETILREKLPILVVNYVTESAPADLAGDMRGKVVGLYEVTNKKGGREEFTHPKFRDLEPTQWRYALKASRAFEILPEYRPTIRDFDPSIRQEGRELPVAKHGALLPDSSFQLLKTYPIIEVPVYGENGPTDTAIWTSTTSTGINKGYVHAGPSNVGGYDVPPEPESEKELYILMLKGNTEAFLGRPTGTKNIIKVGLSISPELRRQCFNRAIPNGAYNWVLCNSTTADGYSRYPDFKTAVRGETAMKEYLAQNDEAEWLGGEFYLATKDVKDRAWKIGREAATGVT